MFATYANYWTLNKRFAEQRALLIQNAYNINEKQCLPPPFYRQPPVGTTHPHFYKKILIPPLSMIFAQAQHCYIIKNSTKYFRLSKGLVAVSTNTDSWTVKQTIYDQLNGSTKYCTIRGTIQLMYSYRNGSIKHYTGR